MVVDAFLGGYRYRKDTSGNVTDKIHEEHPYEEPINCLQYFYIEIDAELESRLDNLEVAYSPMPSSKYLGR